MSDRRALTRPVSTGGSYLREQVRRSLVAGVLPLEARQQIVKTARREGVSRLEALLLIAETQQHPWGTDQRLTDARDASSRAPFAAMIVTQGLIIAAVWWLLWGG